MHSILKIKKMPDRGKLLYAKSVIVINMTVIVTFLLFLPQCKKCKTCFQGCASCYVDTTHTKMDTICSSSFNTFTEYQDSINKMACSYLSTPDFSECKASAAQLKGAECYYK